LKITHCKTANRERLLQGGGCEKEEYVPIEQDNSLISKFESEGKFKEEIIVSDESGRNQAFYAIYSDDKDLLAEYITQQEFVLKTNEFDVEDLKSYDFSSDDEKEKTELFKKVGQLQMEVDFLKKYWGNRQAIKASKSEQGRKNECKTSM
jgi:hypothetical protein